MPRKTVTKTATKTTSTRATAAASPAPALRLTLERARAHWHRRQGLAEPVKGTIEEVIDRTGWPRTLGGVDVYLSLRARIPGLRRAELDRAVEEGRVQVVPAVRGCIYLVPRALAPLALKVAEEPHMKRTASELARAGAAAREIEELGEAVVAALGKGALSPDGLRRTLPAGTVRSLGDKGKKVGISSTLPPALRALEFAGKVERVLDGGRLDSERYHWRLPRKGGPRRAPVPATAAARAAALAEVFFASAGPAAASDFACWSGLSLTAARAAIAAAPLVPVRVEGYSDDAYVLADQLPELGRRVPASDRVGLIAFEDNYLTAHGGPAVLTDPCHHRREVGAWGSSKAGTLGDTRHVVMRALLDGDRLAGFWEYDPEREAVVFSSFDPLKPARRKAVEAEAAELASFIRDDLGHARSFSLDTMDEVRKRAALVRAMK